MVRGERRHWMAPGLIFNNCVGAQGKPVFGARWNSFGALFEFPRLELAGRINFNGLISSRIIYRARNRLKSRLCPFTSLPLWLLTSSTTGGTILFKSDETHFPAAYTIWTMAKRKSSSLFFKKIRIKRFELKRFGKDFIAI